MKLIHSSSPPKIKGHPFVLKAWLECSQAWHQDMSTQNVALYSVLQRDIDYSQTLTTTGIVKLREDDFHTIAMRTLGLAAAGPGTTSSGLQT